MFTNVVFFVVLVVLLALCVFNAYLLVSAFQMYKDMTRVRKECEVLRNVSQNFRDDCLNIFHHINHLTDEKN